MVEGGFKVQKFSRDGFCLLGFTSVFVTVYRLLETVSKPIYYIRRRNVLAETIRARYFALNTQFHLSVK
jgi:hypothetical protein